MDTSDECDIELAHTSFVDNQGQTAAAQPGGSKDKRFSMDPEQTPEQQADQMVKDAERSRARLLGIPGNNDILTPYTGKVAVVDSGVVNGAQIDQDYQMLDMHVDETIEKCIQAFEYVDFSKLVSRNKLVKDDDQRLEIVNHNGMTFLSPIADRENVQITSYIKWEQAFRVFSNILTSKFPAKATELLQYNHTIHTASMAYIWDNVYAYDKEF